MKVQRAVDREPQPWRNGRGVQYAIAANDRVSDDWTWKLSTADITEDVPFSVFPDVSRQFCVADGNGVELTIDGTQYLCRAGSITSFGGDADTRARLLEGPMKALNLMTRNADDARLDVLDTGRSGSRVLAVVAICGSCDVDIDGQLVSLQVLDAVLDLNGSEVRVAVGRAAILIRD